jgi:hypothetical protein
VRLSGVGLLGWLGGRHFFSLPGRCCGVDCLHLAVNGVTKVRRLTAGYLQWIIRTFFFWPCLMASVC